jgi:hypothetical protein
MGGRAMNDKSGADCDDRVIEIDKPQELAYWVKFLCTSKDELYAAVSEVGVLAQTVRQHLSEKAKRAR